MTTLDLTLLTGLVAVIGRWSQDKGVDVPSVIGFVFVAIMLSVIQSVNEKVARAIAWLLLLSVALIYVPDVSSKVIKTARTRTPAPKGGTP